MSFSSRGLFDLCLGYFVFYVVTGVAVKYFLGPAAQGYPGFDDMTYLVYSTIGGNLLCLAVVLFAGWYRIGEPTKVRVLGVSISREALFIIPSGVCTAV